MEFSEFTQTAYLYLGGGLTEGGFVSKLLIHFVDDRVPENKPPYNLDESTLRSFYNGRRMMSRVSRKILGHIDTDKFDNYLDSFSHETLKLLSEKLSQKDGSLTQLEPKKAITASLLHSLELSALAHPGPQSRAPLNRIAIEKEIGQLLKGIQNIKNSTELVRLEYNAVKVKNKIILAGFDAPRDILIKYIERNVVLYYKFIENQIRLLENSGTFDSKRIFQTVKAKYEELKITQPDAVTIYFSIREWLQNEAQASDEIAADILTSFFVQNCEVFDAPSK